MKNDVNTSDTEMLKDTISKRPKKSKIKAIINAALKNIVKK